MTKHIESYYKSEFKEACWLVGIAIMNFTLGLFAIGYWGNVGAGILVILGGFAIYQIVMGLGVLIFGQKTIEKKLYSFEKHSEWFIANEIKVLEEESAQSQKNKTYKMISFLVGILCLLMGAFGNWGELILGIGAGLSLQSAIMLIFGLLFEYRTSFYLQKLRK